LLLNFLELMGAIAINPSQYAEKVADIRILFINFHHLLNEYRPHQARESLILTMEGQLARSRAETKGIERMKEQIEGLLRGLGDAAGNDEADVKTEGADTQAESVDATSKVWDELRREFA
jgi:mediator of RNA polymerase II transcription subunit 7